MSFPKKSWTTEEETQLLSSLRRGLPWDKIAKDHDRTQYAIKLRFGMVCKKALETKTIQQISQEYGRQESEIHQCMDALDNIKKTSIPTTIDPADIMLMKEEILLINEKVDKIYRCVKKLCEKKKT